MQFFTKEIDMHKSKCNISKLIQGIRRLFSSHDAVPRCDLWGAVNSRLLTFQSTRIPLGKKIIPAHGASKKLYMWHYMKTVMRRFCNVNKEAI